MDCIVCISQVAQYNLYIPLIINVNYPCQNIQKMLRYKFRTWCYPGIIVPGWYLYAQVSQDESFVMCRDTIVISTV